MREYERRAIHMTGIGMPAIYLLGIVSWTGLRYFMLVVTAIVFLLEFLRLVVGLNHWLYDRVTRPYEQHSIAGYALYMLSMTAVVVVFGPTVALPAMVVLILGDPISGALSTNAADEHKRPTVVAITFLIGVVAALPLTVAWAGSHGVVAATVGAVAGAAADGVKPVIRGVAIDDNLTIPPAVAVGIAGTFWTIGVDPGLDPMWL